MSFDAKTNPVSIVEVEGGVHLSATQIVAVYETDLENGTARTRILSSAGREFIWEDTREALYESLGITLPETWNEFLF